MTLRIAAGLVAALAFATLPARSVTLTHAIALAGNIEAGRSAFIAAGFNVAPAEPIPGKLLHAVIPFRDGTFLEIISARPGSPYASSIASYTRSGMAMVDAGFKVANVARQRETLRALGFRMDPLDVEKHWIDLDFSDPTGLMVPFFYYQGDDDAEAAYERKAAPLYDHPNGANGVRRLEVAVEPGQHAARVYASAGLNGIDAVENGAGDARIVTVYLAAASARDRGKVIVIQRCRIVLE